MAGAGPVGLVTAINAALNGLDVVVVEPRGGPIDKACGEGLMPDAVARMARIGVDPAGIPLRGIRYIAGDHLAEACFSNAPGRGVRRTALSDAACERARGVGARFVEGRVDAIVQAGGWIEGGGMRARYLVGADGLHSKVRSTLGLAAAGGGRARFGVRQHFAISPWSDMVEVYWLSDAEVYITPVGDKLVGVAVLGAAPLHLDEAIARLPELATHLESATPASVPRGAGPLRQRTTARHAGRAFLVGDAGGYVDALTGEGLRVGFAEAEAVVRAVLADDPRHYEAEWHRITRSYRWLTNGLLWTASRRTLRPLIVPAARALPTVFSRIVDSLAS
ncbi:MAG: NAD(P)/FAD-dependent oxidoreductase [Actinomycetota bacterium]